MPEEELATPSKFSPENEMSASWLIAQIEEYAQMMYKIAMSILQNSDDASDAVQDTALACWEKRASLREKSYFKTWMTRILINKCYDIGRKKGPEYPALEMPETPYVEQDYAVLEWKELMAGLKEPYRTVLWLSCIEGFSASDIAAILDLPQATVRTRLARGRKWLAKAYGIPEKIYAERASIKGGKRRHDT